MGPECHGPRVPAVSGSVLLFCDATHPQAESHPRSLFPKDSPINGPRNRNTAVLLTLLLALCWRRADGCVGHTSVHGLIVTPVLGGLECVRVRSVCARVVLNSSSSTHCGTTSCCAGGHGSTQAAAEAVPRQRMPGESGPAYRRPSRGEEPDWLLIGQANRRARPHLPESLSEHFGGEVFASKGCLAISTTRDCVVLLRRRGPSVTPPS